MTCTSNGSRPAAKITWWKGKKQLQHTRESINRVGVSTSMLTFVPSVDDNGKFLICRAENPLISNSVLEDGWKLEIYFPPQVSLHFKNLPTSGEIQEGNDVYLECNIRSNPWIHSISWQFEGQDIKTNLVSGIMITNQTLVIQRVQLSHRGHFTCSASNTEGLGVSNKIYINIKYAPKCRPEQKTIFGVAKQETVHVSCSLVADPLDVTFSWMFNSSTKQSGEIQYRSNKTHSVAIYTPKMDNDYGTLLCWGTNDVGIQRKPCVFTIMPAGPPESPYNCSVLNQTENLIHLECTEANNGGLKAEFTLEVYNVGRGTLKTNFSSPRPKFVVNDLPAGTALRLLVYASNSKGRSEPVIISATTLRPAEKRMDKPHPQTIVIVQPLFTALISVVITLVLIAVVVVIALKLRSKRKLSEAQIDRSGNEKSHMPFKKDIDEFTDMDDKGPDIIPSRMFYRSSYPDYSEDRYFQLNCIVQSCYTGQLMSDTSYNTSCPIRSPVERTESLCTSHLSGMNLSNRSPRRTSPEGVTYAELALPRIGQCSSAVRQPEPPTEYATIKGQLQDTEDDDCTTSCETPLMTGGRRESAV
ncbi:uncharacterized protein LOC143238454 [Tachypleus tridentatus]|uniref:uncharacterized protein LOC143238454 n=1 Tax=Tachypleus tridentatus TaxID=6853 RepID=UPI003FCEF041